MIYKGLDTRLNNAFFDFTTEFTINIYFLTFSILLYFSVGYSSMILNLYSVNVCEKCERRKYGGPQVAHGKTKTPNERTSEYV